MRCRCVQRRARDARGDVGERELDLDRGRVERGAREAAAAPSASRARPSFSATISCSLEVEARGDGRDVEVLLVGQDAVERAPAGRRAARVARRGRPGARGRPGGAGQQVVGAPEAEGARRHGVDVDRHAQLAERAPRAPGERRPRRARPAGRAAPAAPRARPSTKARTSPAAPPRRRCAAPAARLRVARHLPAATTGAHAAHAPAAPGGRPGPRRALSRTGRCGTRRRLPGCNAPAAVSVIPAPERQSGVDAGRPPSGPCEMAADQVRFSCRAREA